MYWLAGGGERLLHPGDEFDEAWVLRLYQSTMEVTQSYRYEAKT